MREIKFKSFFEKKNTELINTIIEMVDKLDNRKQSELHGGYDDADYLRAYSNGLYDIKTLLQEAIK
jgi:hypothetical protein